MQLPHIIASFLLFFLGWVEAAGKTSIYIDQIPLYSSLQQCAQDQLSTIVRAQFSGCGDDMQLTSFACFCIDSSSEFSSIISTAVASQCEIAATATGGRVTSGNPSPTTNAARRLRARASVTPAPTPSGAVAADVLSALEAFNSYCSKSTELTRFNQQSTIVITQGPQTIFTASPSSTPSSPPNSEDKKSTPVAAIVVPVVLVPIAAAIALFFFLRHRRSRRALKQPYEADSNPVAPPPREMDSKYAMHSEMYGDETRRYEMGVDSKRETKVGEMEHPPVELDAATSIPSSKDEKEKSGFV